MIWKHLFRSQLSEEKVATVAVPSKLTTLPAERRLPTIRFDHALVNDEIKVDLLTNILGSSVDAPAKRKMQIILRCLHPAEVFHC